MIRNNLRKISGNSLGDFENAVVFEEFNMEQKRPKCYTFIGNHSFTNLIISNTWFKLSSGTCMNLILKNRPMHFQIAGVLETGVGDHHGLIYSFFKTTFHQRCLRYQAYDRFDKNIFLEDLNLLNKTSYIE